MGTKVQCKSYLPEYYPMRDLNEEANSNCSPYYEDKMLSGHLYNGFMLRPVTGYSGYDKEILKRTMLEHEDIFRKQVYELHRLYRIQKDLMDELKKNGLYRYSLPMDVSQPNSFPSQMPFEDSNKIWQMSCLPAANTGYSRPSVVSTDDMMPPDMMPPLNFLQEGSIQVGPIQKENGGSKNGDLLGTELKRIPKRVFDLQLPADVYIDIEDAERIEIENDAESSFRARDPLNSCGVESENDVKLTLGTGDDHSCREDSWKSDSPSQNGPSTRNLADLNEPIKEIYCKEAAGPTHFLGPRTYCEEILGHQLPMRSHSSFLGLHKDFSKDRHKEEGSCSNFLPADEETRREWPFFGHEAGFGNKKSTMSPEPIQLKHKEAHVIPSFILPDQNKTETQFSEKLTHGIEISGRSTHLASSSYSGLTAQPPSPFSVPPHSDCTSNASPLVSSLRKPGNIISHIPIAVQALPCFNGGSATMNTHSRSPNKAIQNPSSAYDKWQCNGDMKSQSRFGNSYQNSLSSNSEHLHLPSVTFGKPNLDSNGELAAYENFVSHKPRKFFKSLPCTDVKAAKDVNLSRTLTNGILDGLTSQHDPVICDIEGRHEELSGGISWLRTKQACKEPVNLGKCVSQIELDSSQSYSQLTSSCSVVALGYERKQEKGKDSSMHIQDFQSTLQVDETRMQRSEVFESWSGKRILGFPILERIQQSSLCSPPTSHQERSLTDDSKCRGKDDTKPSLESPVYEESLVVEKGVGNKDMGFRTCINLNSMETCLDHLKLVDISPEGEAKFASDINFREPAASQGEENIHPQGELLVKNHLVPPVQLPLSKTDGSNETVYSHETLVRVAAENIVAMSLDTLICFPCRPLEPVPIDSLSWFAEVVASNAGDDGLDSFEAMTLKLEETKVDEYLCKPQELDNRKEGGKGNASLLLTKPRRGQARRRQRRDFQKDILPGLASLSRHEVTEDLQTIAALFRASGRSWPNMGRNGLTSQARGRRRPRSLAVTVEEYHTSPTPMQITNSELEIEGRNIIGWGRTTRRCRSQRCPSGNVSSAPPN